MLIEIKAGQFRKVSRLVRRECCNCMDGNCLLLDDGETHTCVQLISKSRNKRYCNQCAEQIKRQKAAERKRRQRERQKQLLYINN